VNVRHDAIIVEKLTVRGTDRVIETHEVPALEFRVTMEKLWSLMYNALGVSGGVLWRHPTTGEIFPGLQYSVDVKEPWMKLEEGQLCECAKCVPVNA
jgi:hypothetical protein